MMQTYADWRGAVMDERTVPTVAGYIPEEHKRRMQCADVLCKYMAGASFECYQPEHMTESLEENWVDTAPVYMLADALAGLTLLGFRLSGEDEDMAKTVQTWLLRSKTLVSLRQAERTCNATGDAVVLVRWNALRREPQVEAYLPGMYLPLGDASALLFWGRPEAKWRNKLFVEHYTVGSEGKVIEENKVRVTGRTMAGVRSGWVDLNERTAAGNERELQDRLSPGVFSPLGIDRLPLVHIPNGETDMDGWGTSDFWQALGLVDMFNELMTDRRKGARFLQPPMVTWGDGPPLDKQNRPSIKYAPNSIYYVGATGGMTIPDFSNMLKATHDEQQAVWGDILRTIGLCKAMLGDVGDVSNRRDREVRLMYQPGRTKVLNRREERMQYWQRVLGLVADVWRANDAAGYKERMLDADMSTLSIECDDVLPEDVAEIVTTLTGVKNAGGLDRETYTGEAIKALGIAGDAAEIAAKAGQEEASGLGLQSWPKAGAAAPA
ncbi:MAG: hypothetical protein NTV22_11350 [bacterium]|nr:hypothetical protein [bacterium]